MSSKMPKSSLMTALLCALMWMVSGAAQVQAKDLYVSPSGDGTSAETWKTAWKSFQTIDWSKVAAGDQIIVDGGTEGISYPGGFTIPASNIVIRQAGGEKRRGQVSIVRNGVQDTSIGITITGSNVHIVGNTRSGIKVSSFGAECIRVQTNGNVLRNLRIGGVGGFPPYGQGRVAALTFGGVNNQFISCDFRDFTRCAMEKPVAGAANVSVFRNCTFGNDGYGWWGEWGVGIYGARASATPVDSTIFVRHCVFGPIQNKGIDFNSGKLQVGDSLFLGSNYGNFIFEPPAGSTAKAAINNCTFYEPNFSGYAQYNMRLHQFATNGNGVLRVRDSIVYGGVINVPATQVVSAGGNVQYHVTGNTTALASALVDPQYVAETTLWTPVTGTTISPRVWTTQSYALTEGSPATGKGSSITDVTAITPAYGPIYRLPPLGGP